MTEEELQNPDIKKFEIVITAVGEVRDADGNLVEQIPIESTQIVTEAELREMQGVTK